jgi:hypothetical protein
MRLSLAWVRLTRLRATRWICLTPLPLSHAGLTEPSYSAARFDAIVVGLGEADSSAGCALDLSHPPLPLNHAGLIEPSYRMTCAGAASPPQQLNRWLRGGMLSASLGYCGLERGWA